MRMKPIFITLALAVLVAVGALWLAEAAAGPTTTTAEKVGVAYFREKVTAYNTSGSSAASTEAWRTRVYLLRRQQAVGTGGIACIRVTRTVRECYGTYVLPEGRIKIEGEITDRMKFQLVVIGGTGTYTGASGVASFGGLSLVTFYLT